MAEAKDTMTGARFSPEELLQTAKEFARAEQETQAMVDRLDNQVRRLEETWSDAGQQVFYQYYQEWRQHMGGFSQVLHLIAVELEAIADRYLEASR